MLFRIETPVKRMFSPPLPPPPQRIPSELPVDPQKGCAFLTKLPPELRNEIYTLVFGAGFEEEKIPEQVEDDKVDGEGEVEVEGGMNGSSSVNLHTPRVSNTEEEMGETSMCEKSDLPRPTPPPPEPAPKPAHALSLLLTCRAISQEATILAFATHTFTLRQSSLSHSHHTFHSLKHSTAHLSPLQFSSITSLALDFHRGFSYQKHETSLFIANAMLLFPTVQRLQIRVKKSKASNAIAHHTADSGSYTREPMEESLEIRNQALKRYVPSWWYGRVNEAIDGRAFSWQTGHKWRVEWPQFDSPFYTEYAEYTDDDDASHAWNRGGGGTTSPDADVDMCPCGCGALRWLSAHLIQETGRVVHVSVVYNGDGDAEALAAMKVQLRPLVHSVVEPLPVQWVNGTEGAIWDVDEAYWEEKRRRNQALVDKVKGWKRWGLW
ncbi:hypothetical protein K504DRAFT_507490 [Pleomassaria siparia CBS 279.74]|uniref:DUF7730 domain-containing protein n=1 Tax=Pleomassaria siparia CBS 279.74 TaxID=1314801 RepID=A0A6G1JTM7_9PLEO|nr:hypothetical protein K504DRAFT_507490 [Pleomassaria siparia CBS 279.74]